MGNTLWGFFRWLWVLFFTVECCHVCRRPKNRTNRPGDERREGWAYCVNPVCVAYREPRASAVYRPGLRWLQRGTFPAFVRRYFSVKRFGRGDSRWWVRLGVPRPDAEGVLVRPVRLIAEWARFGPRAGVTYSRDEDHTLWLGLGWSLYLSWDARRVGRHGRSWGASIWGDRVRLEWACDDSMVSYFTDDKGKRRSKPRLGWQWSCSLMNVLFGRQEYASVERERRTLPLIMPEGTYQADCRVTLDTWWRSRWPHWPLTRQLERAQIDFDPPVGLPGKGENAYDCDDDATYSVTTPLKHGSLRATLDEIALDTLRKRQQRGGLTWAPREGWPTGVAAD